MDGLLLFAVGCVAGLLNVVAGGGSFLTLPVLMFTGLPAGVANATNRVGILMQNVGAVWGFRRHGVFDARALTWTALPATFGAGLGAWAALEISDRAFQRVLAFLMVAISLWSLLSPRGAAPIAPTERPERSRTLLAGAGFFLVGIYGGFVQAGVGFLMLAVTTWVGVDLVRGNAVKVATVLCFTVLSLAVFVFEGRVEWAPGLALGAGTVLGGLVGVRLTVLKGHRWVRAVVTVTVIVFAVVLWFSE